jgi:hypothetical protein
MPYDGWYGKYNALRHTTAPAARNGANRNVTKYGS